MRHRPGEAQAALAEEDQAADVDRLPHAGQQFGEEARTRPAAAAAAARCASPRRRPMRACAPASCATGARCRRSCRGWWRGRCRSAPRRACCRCRPGRRARRCGWHRRESAIRAISKPASLPRKSKPTWMLLRARFSCVLLNRYQPPATTAASSSDLPDETANLLACRTWPIYRRLRPARARREEACPARAMAAAISGSAARTSRRPWSTARSRRAGWPADRCCAGTARRSCPPP